jgi:hypothetical protein
MEAKMLGNFKAIIPHTKICRDVLKDIFQKEYRQKTRPAQQSSVKCVATRIEGRRQWFGAPNVKVPYVLKKVSRHSTPS